MKILILNPMSTQAKNVVRDVLYGCWCSGKRIGGGTVPPFNLLVLTSILLKDGFDVDFIDAQAEQISQENISKTIHRYDSICMSTSTMTFKEDASFLKTLKLLSPNLKTIVFGSHPTFMPNYCLSEDGIDIIITHEPEHTLRDLMRRLRSRQNYYDLSGIGMVIDGEIRINPPAPHIKNLDELPFPDISLLPKNIDYFNPIVRRLPYITTSTSKGCPGKCTFCTAPAFDGHVYRYQSADYVLTELKYFAANGIREVYFRDDTFFVKKERDHAIFNGIIDSGIDITWLANARVDMIDEATIELAKKAGCHTIKFGIESGSQEILDGIRKNYKIEKAFQVFDWLKKHKMCSHAHVMIGSPGETRATVEKTIQFVLDLNPTTASFGICTPYPGTPLFNHVRELCPELGDGSATNLSKLHIEGIYNEHYTELSHKELKHYLKKAYRKFYIRPQYWLRTLKTMVTSVEDFKRVSIAATNLINFIYN